jgi:transcriptional regulator with XRE-family HTH domain
LAKQLDITLGRLAQIEQGDPPRVDRLVAIAQALGCSASELMGDATVWHGRPPTVKQLGKRIRLRRVELDLNQASLGKRIGMLAPQLGRIERGERFMRLDQLEAIAKELHCPVGYLLGEVPHPEGGWLASPAENEEIT